MNPNYTEFKFPQIKAHPWSKVFHKRLKDRPWTSSRTCSCTPPTCDSGFGICCHRYFDDLRIRGEDSGREAAASAVRLHRGRVEELHAEMRARLIPEWYRGEGAGAARPEVGEEEAGRLKTLSRQLSGNLAGQRGGETRRVPTEGRRAAA